jgi:hypothetical protein
MNFDELRASFHEATSQLKERGVEASVRVSAHADGTVDPSDSALHLGARSTVVQFEFADRLPGRYTATFPAPMVRRSKPERLAKIAVAMYVAWLTSEEQRAA